MAEHLLPKQGVVGSNPISRSKLKTRQLDQELLNLDDTGDFEGIMLLVNYSLDVVRKYQTGTANQA